MAKDANGMDSRDANQVIRTQAKELADGSLAQQTVSVAELVNEPYDHLDLTYVTSGNGVGEIETVSYRTGGPAGTIVATLTLAYDASNNLISVTRS